jgi:raffinose/stachyose/melibiose transport system substrate-binding protein
MTARTSRTLLAASAAALLATGLAACDSGTGSSGGGSNSLRLATVATDRPGLEAVIAKFKKQNPGVKINTSYSDTDQYQSTLRTQLSAGTAPDVFFTWPGNGNPGALQVLQPSGYLEDLSGQPWVSKIPAGIRSVTQVGGKTYIAPLSFVGIGALYNETTLKQVGLTPPTTWTGLLAFCDAAKGKGKAAFALGNQTNWVTQLVDYALVATTVYSTNPDFDTQQKAGRATFPDSGWSTAVDKYLEMNRRGCFQADPLGTSVDASISLVTSGKALGMIQVTSELATLKEKSPAGTTYTVQPVPATDDATQTRMPGAAGGSYAVNAKTGKKSLANKFIAFAASDAGQNAYATAVSALPAIPNAQSTPEGALAVLVRYQKEGRTVPFMDQLWPNPKVQAAHFAGVQDLFAGKSSVAGVLGQMQAAYKQG